MKGFVAPSVGLLGRIVAILLLTLLIEFGASTLLYERASQFSVKDDEANRLAEHLVISRRLMAERAPDERPMLAAELTTNRYALEWGMKLPPPPVIAPDLDAVRGQIHDWEPSLRSADLRLRLTSPGRSSVITGALRLPDNSWLYFRTLEPVTDLNLAPERIALALIPAIALMLLGGMLVGRTLNPLRRLAEAADKVGGDAAEPVPEDGPGEVRRVVVAFNRMQARIARLIDDRTQALAAVGHDLRTPLSRLRLRSDAIERDDVREAVGEDIAEMEAMITSLLAFLGGDSDPETPMRHDLAVLCATVVDDAADHGRDAFYDGPDHCETVVRARSLKRAVVNLLNNALHYGTRATVRLEDRPHEIVIAVEDNGPGIPEDQLASVVEPFVRLDTARGRDTVGFGLGLAIVKQAVELEGGRLSLANREEGGLRACLHLPR
ncbi:ATP-binding protein [Sphingomonas aracearum]|uniref:histidine kinase n=1 Tax=Sphingomonas aracearum TaxID=2283317 RepID=A0A369VUW0_9SPHN|nr:ATP-binding protein [Sphingomonas aracearum]RDE04862.1 HAMP domain-containing protein [Sphingomonas aracearum]